jgi:hypothetical protein
MTAPDDRVATGSASDVAASAPWLRIGLGLVVATIAYNVIEAVVALWSGVVAESVALVGFGLDSALYYSSDR